MRIDCLPGVSVTIRVDGRDLLEYNTDEVDEDDNTVSSAFVEALPGANFSVELILGKTFPYKRNDLSFDVHLDGAWARGLVLDLDNNKNGQPGTINGVVTEDRNGSTMKIFVFAEHKTS